MSKEQELEEGAKLLRRAEERLRKLAPRMLLELLQQAYELGFEDGQSKKGFTF